jgi:hypothetical protein
VQAVVEVGQHPGVLAQPDRVLEGRFQHGGPLEALHDQIALAGIEDRGSRISTVPHVTHHLGLALQGPAVTGQSQHPTRPMLEDFGVSALAEVRPDRIHRSNSVT